MADEILVVDENPGIQQSLKRLLSHHGYSVVTTNTVQEAAHLISQFLPSLVILDIKMPHWDGIKFIHTMKKSKKPLPIIVMTAYPTFFTQEEALKIGSSAYLVKPFEAEEILECIQQFGTSNKNDSWKEG